MACKKYIYAAGDTTWVTTFMEAIEKSWKGLQQVTLTNYDTTTACSIEEGSVLEVAGSLYIATSDSAIGTAGISTALQYIQAIGSVGGCVFAYNAVAPTWRDDYQGYYASAASTTRIIGGINYTGSYTEKWIYQSPDKHKHTRRSGSLRPLKSSTTNIGDWDMDATAVVTISLATLGAKNDIVHTDALIRDDADTYLYTFTQSDPSAVIWTDVTNLNLQRTVSGFFDNTSFNLTSFNRGWYTVLWEDGR